VSAREPQPTVGATGQDPQLTLSWRAGREAATHEVYLGTDRQAVGAGAVPVATVSQSSYDPAALTLGRTYYWKVNEVNATKTPAVWEGDIWDFTVADSVVVEDCESYTDQAGSTVYETWLDGSIDKSTGSIVGLFPDPINGTFCETTIVHGGRQSMPLSYNNTGGFSLSEAERTFAPAQDWTRSGIALLSLWFRGDPNNSTGKLYLKINGVKAAYNGDGAALKAASWTQWKVDLASVTTNLQKVTKLGIGLESGGKGILYVDDIQLLPAAVVLPSAITVTVSAATSVKATGNDGTIQSIHGIDASGLVLGKTTTDYEKYADHPAAHADDFNLGTYASLDEAKAITVKFAVAVTTIFLIERGGNDSGFVQPLDAAGKPAGDPVAFTTAHWLKLSVTVNAQAAGALAITAPAPIFGIALLPPTGGVTGVDPASIAAVPAP